ncbi:DUF5986 family protein [Shouchella rhizosphaerae]|uniref:DUF5986 family protein n=1 Tax=Shouchella rhizosphaerae TaxID=866786 RepID=UPI003F7FE552
MNIGTNLKDDAIKDMVKAFSASADGEIYEIEMGFGLERTRNFKNGVSWDITFRNIAAAAEKHGLEVIKIKRGIWNFIALMDPRTGYLFVFTKENNLEMVIKNSGKKSIHYFYAFIAMHDDITAEFSYSCSLIPQFDKEYEEKRIIEAQKILDENFSRVKRVIFVTKKKEMQGISTVKAKLYDKNFFLVDTEDWSHHASDVGYGDLLENDELESPTLPMLAKVKPNIKELKRSKERELVKKKAKERNGKITLS